VATRGRWADLAPATCLPSGCFCEGVRPKGLAQPVNARAPRHAGTPAASWRPFPAPPGSCAGPRPSCRACGTSWRRWLRCWSW